MTRIQVHVPTLSAFHSKREAGRCACGFHKETVSSVATSATVSSESRFVSKNNQVKFYNESGI